MRFSLYHWTWRACDGESDQLCPCWCYESLKNNDTKRSRVWSSVSWLKIRFGEDGSDWLWFRSAPDGGSECLSPALVPEWRTRPCTWAHMRSETMARFMRRATMDGTCPNSTSAKKVSSNNRERGGENRAFKSPADVPSRVLSQGRTKSALWWTRWHIS